MFKLPIRAPFLNVCRYSYFASKSCTYTDASGRLVSAPRELPPESTQPNIPERFTVSSTYRAGGPSSSHTTLDCNSDDQTIPKKRYRLEPIARPPQPIFDGTSGLDPTLTRE